MNLNVTPTDPAALEAIGQEHLAARRYAAAADAFEAAAAMSERPAGELALKLARSSLEAGRPAAAAAALVGIVDSSTSFRTWAGAAGLIARCPEETWPGLRHRRRAGLVGTWTTNTFAPLLRLAAARHGIALDIDQPPFGQYFNATLDPGSELLAAAPYVLVLAPDSAGAGAPAGATRRPRTSGRGSTAGPGSGRRCGAARRRARPARICRARRRPARPPRRRASGTG